MAKTNRRPSDKFERKARLAQRPQREDNQDWKRAPSGFEYVGEDDDDFDNGVADDYPPAGIRRAL